MESTGATAMELSVTTPTGLTVIVKERDCTLAALSATWTVNEYEPTVVGVPERTPFEESGAKPGGREPEVRDQVYGGVPPTAWRPKASKRR